MLQCKDGQQCDYLGLVQVHRTWFDKLLGYKAVYVCKCGRKLKIK